MSDLFAKYDVPAPRYTSYPTVPYWATTPSQEEWLNHVRTALRPAGSSWSLYLHIPFCESLCTFCGCNNIITKDHGKEIPYVSQLLKEWKVYLENIPELKTKPIRQIHLGGGTPTFLSAQSLTTMLEPIFSTITKDSKNFEASIEVDPRRTNFEQLKALHKLGFNRLSLGVQDFNPEVQKMINRVQSFEVTRDLTVQARSIGYDSINFDLIYGLPKQDLNLMKKTIEQTLLLGPDRIALYSFALVPWIKPAHRIFKDEDLPSGEEKRQLYELAREMLLANSYVEIGMDHFAKPTDSLAQAMMKQTLHRNFMGYTDHRTDVMLGLGVSAISETPDCFHQNEKLLPKYENALTAGNLPTLRGHKLSAEDKLRREQVLQLMTRFQTRFEIAEQETQALQFLKEMIADQLIEIEDQTLFVTDKGRPFLRNACVFFDEHLKRKQPEVKIFSQSL